MRETASSAPLQCSGVSRVAAALIDRAETYASQGRVPEARSAFHAAIAADDTPAARLSFAAFLTAHGDCAAAERHLRSALDVAHHRNQNDERCDCTLSLSKLAMQRGDDASALTWLQQAVKWQLIDSGELSASVLLQQSLLSIRGQCMAEASRLLRAALATANDEDRAEMILHLGIVDRLNGNNHAAVSRLAEAYRLFQSQGDLEGCAFALVNSGHTLQDLGQDDEAGASFEQAQRIFASLGQSLRAKRAAGFAREVGRVGSLQSETFLLN